MAPRVLHCPRQDTLLLHGALRLQGPATQPNSQEGHRRLHDADRDPTNGNGDRSLFDVRRYDILSGHSLERPQPHRVGLLHNPGGTHAEQAWNRLLRGILHGVPGGDEWRVALRGPQLGYQWLLAYGVLQGERGKGFLHGVPSILLTHTTVHSPHDQEI